MPSNRFKAVSHYIQRDELMVGLVNEKAERSLCMILINSGLDRSKCSLITSLDGWDLRGNLNQITSEIPQHSLCSKTPSSEGMCANISPQLPGLPHTHSCPSESHARQAQPRWRVGEGKEGKKENENRHDANGYSPSCLGFYTYKHVRRRWVKGESMQEWWWTVDQTEGENKDQLPRVGL